MEADWEVEIGGGAPVIEASWSGFVDLGAEPQRAAELPEASQLPALGEALRLLNANSSPVWTAKCDVWPAAEFDPDELDAPPEAAKCALACYIDLLPRKRGGWSALDRASDWCRQRCDVLRACALRQCRADLVLRSAFLAQDESGFGVTAYLTACGRDAPAALARLSQAVVAFAATIRSTTVPETQVAKLQWKNMGE